MNFSALCTYFKFIDEHFFFSAECSSGPPLLENNLANSCQVIWVWDHRIQCCMSCTAYTITVINTSSTALWQYFIYRIFALMWCEVSGFVRYLKVLTYCSVAGQFFYEQVLFCLSRTQGHKDTLSCQCCHTVAGIISRNAQQRQWRRKLLASKYGCKQCSI